MSIAAGKLPPSAVPRPSNVCHAPFHGGRHGRPVGPEAVLSSVIEVQQEKGYDVKHTGLGDRLLAPDLESLGSDSCLGGINFRRLGVVGECGDGGNLAVEVVLKVVLEGVHDADELHGVERSRRVEGIEVGVEFSKASEEGFCRDDLMLVVTLVKATHGNNSVPCSS